MEIIKKNIGIFISIIIALALLWILIWGYSKGFVEDDGKIEVITSLGQKYEINEKK